MKRQRNGVLLRCGLRLMAIQREGCTPTLTIDFVEEDVSPNLNVLSMSNRNRKMLEGKKFESLDIGLPSVGMFMSRATGPERDLHLM